MKTKYIIGFIFSFLCVIGHSNTSYTQLPPRPEILSKLRQVNSFLMSKWPDPTLPTVTNKVRASNIWTRAVYYIGLIEGLYRIDPDPKYYNYTMTWAKYHNWNFNGGTYTRNADNQAAGQVYLALFEIEPLPERIRFVKMSIDSMMTTEKVDDWWWIDALFMAMPVFAKLGVLLNDSTYWERMYQMYWHTKTQEGGGGLFNPKDGLWWRDARFRPPYREPNGEDCYWSRGNGWVFAALARVLDILPEDAPHREEYLKTFQVMANALLKVQREDGFWNVSLHDPGHFGGPEVTGTSLFVYGFAWGIRNGILPKDGFLSAVIKGWHALSSAVHANGFLGYVQSTGMQPSDGQPVAFDRVPDFQDFAVGLFLLAGSEVYKLAPWK